MPDLPDLPDLIEVTIDSVRVSLMSPQRIVIVREKDTERFLPIWVGPYEAEAITVALQEVEVSRPMTHDLLASVIDHLGAKVKRIVIDDLRNHTFYAKIYLGVDGRTIKVDSRPSDAIALSAALKTPIFVADHVFDKTSQ